MAGTAEAPQFRSPDQYKEGDILLSEEQIQARVKALASEIGKKYKGKKLLMIGLLKGAFKLTTDLTTELHRQGITDLEVDFIRVRNYGMETKASGNPEILQDLHESPQNRHLLVVDDILETGGSLGLALGSLREKGPASIASLVLLDKGIGNGIIPDFVGFNIPRELWVQGYGMDSKGVGRGDPNIRVGHYDYQEPPVVIPVVV